MNTSFTPGEQEAVRILVVATEYLGQENGIAEPLAEEIIRFTRRFVDPTPIIDLFLQAANSQTKINLWELLRSLEGAWDTYWKTPGFHSKSNIATGLGAWELRHIRQEFGF